MTIIKLKSEFVICSKMEVFSDFNTPGLKGASRVFNGTIYA